MRARIVFFVLAASFIMLAAASVNAQTAPSAPATQSVVTPKLTKDGKPLAKEVRANCRSEAAAKGLTKGDAYRAAMKDCIGKQRPDLVKSYECRQEIRAKKLEKAERAAYFKECKARA